ncbi:MAG: MFS transporter [Coriobacteriia bacterium]|nr:MFS transporter [Coriobacteriia bacterium]
MDTNQEQVVDISQQKNLSNKQMLGYSSYTLFSMFGSITWFFRPAYYALIGMNMVLFSTALMIARIVDLVIAVMVGGIIEKVRLKIGGGGKYRPWLFIFMFVITFGIAITFTDFVPNNDTVHFIVVTVGALCVTISMSFIGAVQFGLVPVMAGASVVDRTRLTTFNYRVTTVGTIFTSLTGAYLLTWIGYVFAPPMNYTVMSAGFAGFYILGAIILSRTAKPFDQPQDAATIAAAPQVKVSDMVKAVTTNSQLLVYLLATMLSMIGMLISMNIVIYFWQLIVPYTHGISADVAFPGYYTIGQTASTVGSFVFAMFAPQIGMKLGKGRAMWIGLLGAAVASALMFFFGAGLWVAFIGFNLLLMFAGALYAGFGVNYALDCGEYGLWKTGQDHRLVIMSMFNLPMKIAAIIGGMVLYALAAIGFDSLQVQSAAAQGVLPAFLTDDFVTAFMFLLAGIPAVCNLAAVLLMRFAYKITDEDAKMYAAENQKRAMEAANAAPKAEPETVPTA